MYYEIHADYARLVQYGRLLLLVVLVTLVPSLASASGTAFTPKMLSGTWAGTLMRDERGNYEVGKASIRIRVLSGERMSFSFHWRLAGPDLPACSDLTKPGTLARGNGVNHWNARGFVVSRYGIDATYNHARKTLGATSTQSTCGASMTVQGTFGRTVFRGKFKARQQVVPVYLRAELKRS